MSVETQAPPLEGRALVTGGGGFLGKAIVRRLLDRGMQVRVLARGDYPELREWGAETVRGSVSDPACVDAAVQGCSVVFHVAAKVGASLNPEPFVKTNVEGTQAILDACRKHGVRRLVYTSTPSVVHAGGDVEGADESLPYPEHFEAHYPATKAEAERRVLAANDDSLSTVAIRPHLVWGPGDTNLLPRIVERAKAGRLRLVGKVSKKVDTTYVDNAVDAHVQAAERLHPGAPCAGKAYFVANDEPVPQEQIINGMLAAAGLPPVDKRVSVGVAKTLGAVLEFKARITRSDEEPLMTRWVADQLSTAHWYDLSAAKRDLGYAPKVGVDEGLRRLKASLDT